MKMKIIQTREHGGPHLHTYLDFQLKANAHAKRALKLHVHLNRGLRHANDYLMVILPQGQFGHSPKI